MNFVCSVSPLSVPFLTRGGLSGTIDLHAPFIIPGSGESVTALAYTDTVLVTAVLTESGSVVSACSIAAPSYGTAEILTPLSAMNSETETLLARHSAGADSFLNILSAVYEKTSDTLAVSNTLGDFAFCGFCLISVPLERTGLKGNVESALSPAETITVKDNVTLKSGSSDITNALISAEIDIFSMELAATLQTWCHVPENPVVTINNETYSFETVQFELTEKAVTLKAKLRADSEAVYHNHRFIKASELCAMYTGIVFSAGDFLLKDIYGTKTAEEASLLIADSAGLINRTMPDGRKLLCSPGITSVSCTPKGVTGWQKISPQKTDTFTEIIYGENDSSIAVYADTLTQELNKAVTIKIYGRNSEAVSTAGLKLLEKNIAETATERVFFENGSGRLSRPAFRIFTEGVQAQGRNVTAPPYETFKDITYETFYDKYLLTSGSAGKAAVFARSGARAYTGKTAALSRETVKAPHLTDHVSAVRLVQRKDFMQSGKTLIKACHSSAVNTASGLEICTPYGAGQLTGGRIIISTNPLKVTDLLEVSEWQK